MPTGNERIVNNPLTSKELVRIILTDLSSMIETLPPDLQSKIHGDVAAIFARDGMLSGNTSFGNISYTLKVLVQMVLAASDEDSRTGYSVELVVDLPIIAYPKHRSITNSAPTPKNAAPGADRSIEGPPPLKGADQNECIVIAFERVRRINNPNQERVRFSIPIMMNVRQQDGKIIAQELKYESQEDLGAGDITDTDLTAKYTAEWFPKVAA